MPKIVICNKAIYDLEKMSFGYDNKEEKIGFEFSSRKWDLMRIKNSFEITQYSFELIKQVGCLANSEQQNIKVLFGKMLHRGKQVAWRNSDYKSIHVQLFEWIRV